MEVTVDELLTIIGNQHVRLLKLEQENLKLKDALSKVLEKVAADAPGGAPATTPH
jgi:hypothetical protein